MDKISKKIEMINKRLKILKSKFNRLGIDGYVVPKNDEYFAEYSQKDRLKIISNFSGSAGYAVILKNKNYLFVDGRYTIQAQIESGKNYKIEKLSNIINCKFFKNLTLGIDPKIFTLQQINRYFLKRNSIKIINYNLIDQIFDNYPGNTKAFYSIEKKVVGESHNTKIDKVSKILRKKNADYLFVSAPENVAWLLNIRGHDYPNSPLPNCRLLISKKKKYFLFLNFLNLKILLMKIKSK